MEPGPKEQGPWQYAGVSPCAEKMDYFNMFERHCEWNIDHQSRAKCSKASDDIAFTLHLTI